MAETERRYRAAPIIDAVIELRFENAISDADRDRVSKRLADRYPLVEEGTHHEILLNVRPGGRFDIQTPAQERITKRRSVDQPDLIQIGGSVFDVATGAPYTHWQNLFDRFVEDWATAKRIWKYRRITRIGVRYVNRIDLEPNEKNLIDYEDYLKLRINLPENFPPTNAYDLGFQFTAEEIKCGVTVRSGTTAPAVPGKMSFTLDIDVWRLVDVPQKDAEVLELLGEMRKAKNKLFETFITPKARKLFNAK